MVMAEAAGVAGTVGRAPFLKPSQDANRAPSPGTGEPGETTAPDAGVEVRLLGRFEVTVGSRPVPAQAWEHRRAADLVKLLALSPEHRLTRDEVIEALWPKLSATAGVANLHKAAHYARRALGWPESIVLRRGVVALAPGHRVQTDVELLAEGGGRDGDVAELLPDDRYEEWTAAHRDRLAEVRAEALRRQSRWEDLLRIEPAMRRSAAPSCASAWPRAIAPALRAVSGSCARRWPGSA